MRTYAHAPWQFSRGCRWYNSDKTNCSKVISWGLISHGNEFGDKKMRKHLCCCVSSRCLSVLLIMISGDRGEDCILSCQFVNEYVTTDIFVSDDGWSVIDHLACYDCLYFLRLVLFTNVCLALSVLWVLARGNGVVVNTQSHSIETAKVPGEFKILFEH